MTRIVIVALVIVLLNLPFGHWRSGTKRFSRAWMFAIHIPVLLAIGIRLASGLELRLATLPIFVGAFFVGQFGGGLIRKAVGRGHHG
jgi:hypothetical protein